MGHEGPPCPSCGTPLEDTRTCAICGHVLPDPRLGHVVAGRYRLDAVLGEGGMGVVYRGTHVALGEAVAVKFLKAEWTAKPEFRARFRREAVILAKLRHPGIVSVLDFGEDSGDLFMVMELVNGTPLSDLVGEKGKVLGRLRTFGVFDELLAVLEAAHDEGIVHRDMKPENVMLVTGKDRQDRVKVLDFGIAYLDDGGATGQRLTETGTIRGTPQYMSPEQCKGAEVGAPSDVYSVGVMLFEALTGSLPFDAVEVTGLMVQHMFVEAPLMRETGTKPDVSRGLEALVHRTLAKRPEERPTARAFREELAAIAKGTDVASFEDRAAEERTRNAALSRSDRAITGVTRAAEASLEGATSTSSETVLVWADAARASELRTALAVHGLRAELHASEGAPAESSAASAKALVVASSQAGSAESKIASTRGGAFARVPVLVVDAASAAETAALVRAGASDVALASATDDEIVKKVRRLVRRGR